MLQKPLVVHLWVLMFSVFSFVCNKSFGDLVSFAAVIRVVTRQARSVAWRVTTLITAAKETIGDCNNPQKQEKPRIIHATIALDSC